MWPVDIFYVTRRKGCVIFKSNLPTLISKTRPVAPCTFLPSASLLPNIYFKHNQFNKRQGLGLLLSGIALAWYV